MKDALPERLRDLLPAERVGRWSAPDGRVLPRASPATEDEWSACLQLAERERCRVLPVGGGTKLGWNALPAALDLVLDTAAWRGTVAYEPEDGTLTARSGSTMAELSGLVAAGGHWLSPDVPRAERATLGGVLAAGQSGLDRLRYGGIRDALLGTRVVLADGTRSKSGGRLVKNVTGYDLHRLWCGSAGSLCVVLEASLRLQPAPRARRALSFPCAELPEAFAAARALRASPARPLAVAIRRAPRARGACDVFLYVALAGRPRTVEFELEDVRARLGASGREHGPEDDPWAELRAAEAPDGPHLALAGLPTELEHGLELALAACGDAGLLAHPHLGLATLELASSASPDLAGLRARTGPRTRVALRNAPGAGSAASQPDVVPSARALMRRLARAYDPAGTFARSLEA